MRAAVLGSPIAHSLSPVLHRAAYAALGLDWSYEAVEVGAAELPQFLSACDDSWAGLSLTMPLKEAVLPLLSRTAAEVDLTRAANTVLFEDGRLYGCNTDIDGIVRALHPTLQVPPADPRRADGGRTGLIIGSGATARSAAVALVRVGITTITVAARRREPAEDVCAIARGLGATALATGFDEIALQGHVAAICTLPADSAAFLADRVPPSPGPLLDVTYHPWPTTLAAAWTASGGEVVRGSEMLLWQAAEQVRLMTGLPAPIAAMRAAFTRREAAAGTGTGAGAS